MDNLIDEVQNQLNVVAEQMAEAQRSLLVVADIREKYLTEAKAKLNKVEKAKEKALKELFTKFAHDETPSNHILVLAGGLQKMSEVGCPFGRTKWGVVVQESNQWITQERAKTLLAASRNGDTDLGKDFLQLNENEWVNFWGFCHNKNGYEELQKPINDAKDELAELDKKLYHFELPIIAAVTDRESIRTDILGTIKRWEHIGLNDNKVFISGDSSRLDIVSPK